jgi:hypothetical protein
MSTFACAEECDHLCKPREKTQPSDYGSIIDLAGLTKEEIELIVKSPREARIVYVQMKLAQEMTQKRFGRDWYDDESDAYRHFVWTGLLIKEVGVIEAKKFLDAHESANAPHEPSTIMDRKNNEIATKTAKALQKKGKLSAEELDKAAIRALDKSELKVIRKLGGPKR